MATKEDTLQAFADLSNSLFDLVEDGRFSPDESNILSAEAVAVVGASRNFGDHPAHGDESGAYDAPLAAAEDATRIAKQTQPRRLQPLRDAVAKAIRLLAGVTANNGGSGG